MSNESPKMCYGVFEEGIEVVIQSNGYFRLQLISGKGLLNHFGHIFKTPTPNQGYEEFKKLGFNCEFQGGYTALYFETFEEAMKVKAWFEGISLIDKLKKAK